MTSPSPALGLGDVEAVVPLLLDATDPKSFSDCFTGLGALGGLLTRDDWLGFRNSLGETDTNSGSGGGGRCDGLVVRGDVDGVGSKLVAEDE